MRSRSGEVSVDDREQVRRGRRRWVWDRAHEHLVAVSLGLGDLDADFAPTVEPQCSSIGHDLEIRRWSG
jgi:hypothetical protein